MSQNTTTKSTEACCENTDCDKLMHTAEEAKALTRREVRSLAFHYVYAVDRNDYQVSLDDVIAQFGTYFDVTSDESSFAREIAQGAIDKRDELDTLIKPLLQNWRLERLGCCTHLIIRMALWEMLHGKTAPLIAINEAVELAKGFAEKDAYRFVNGILDEARKRIEQEREEAAVDSK